MNPFTALDRWLCGLRGHDALKAYGDGRMWLRCGCGWESKGVQVTPVAAPQPHLNLLVYRGGKSRKAA